MSDHDPLCPRMRGADDWCICERLRAARADEADQWAAMCHAYLDNYAHAEAVAAKLVDVICEQDMWLRQADTAYEETDRQRDMIFDAMQEARRERDAARAEAASVSAEIDRMVRELSAIRMEHEAEVAALREQVATLRASHRAALRDIAAQVEGLDHADEPCWNVNVGGTCDCPISAVIALIEEAGR